eukprot:1670959-Pyramimonas_sp.AAC.1
MWRPEPEVQCSEQTGLPSWEMMPTLWTRQQWNAGWACRRCLIHIWNVAPDVLDHILGHHSSEVYPTAPTMRKTTAEVPEDSYDMGAHLSPAGMTASVSDAFTRPAPRGEQAPPRDMETSDPDGQSGAEGRASSSSGASFPTVPPPSCPYLPTFSTSRLAGAESDGPVHALVKYAIEWNHTIYKR